MPPRKKCLICGSRQWRKNAVGQVTCSEGHVLQHYINESDEADDHGTHMVKKRTLRSHRKENQRTSRTDPRLYHGDRARFHYYQCLQLLFREQVAALIALWNLPPEFEIICRDLWTFHLDLLPNPLPAEPHHFTREQEGHRLELGKNGHRDHHQLRSENRKDPDILESAAVVPDGTLSSTEDDMLALEISVLLEENSEVSSSDEESSCDEPRARNDMHISSKKYFVTRADRPENTIAVLVLACWTIRIPVVYMDFISAIELHSLPYLDHVRSLPSSLTCHLTKHAVQALSPHYAPKTLSLHRLVSHLATRMYETFDVVIPELNTAPVLWRVVQECLCGTPVLYVLTKRVARKLSLGLSLQDSFAQALSGTADSQKYDNVPPEISLIATAVVALKLVYGLDGKQRFPRTPNDAACALPTATEILAAMRGSNHVDSQDNRHRFGSRVALSMCDLDDVALDEYLEFCQKILADPEMDGGWSHAVGRNVTPNAHGHTETGHRVIDNYFPLTNGTADRMQGEWPDLRGRGFSPAKRDDVEKGVLQPGEKYTIYDGRDVLGNISGDLKMVVERCAQWAGTDCDFVCMVVERYERRLVRWWHDGRQGQKGDDLEDGD